ncbi:MAG TPA: hypothetical protein VK716_18475 [Terracidiphilus sp.]|jgi:hypothetical protein|nr:hypothetical protein [Terracidiphilus sp.]
MQAAPQFIAFSVALVVSRFVLRKKPLRFIDFESRQLQIRLVAESGADADTLTAGRTAAAEDGCAALGLHPRTKAVLFYAAAAVGLKCALWHENALLNPVKNCALSASIQCIACWVLNPVGGRGRVSNRQLWSSRKNARKEANKAMRQASESRAKQTPPRKFLVLSPSLVQPAKDSSNYCEWGIATTLRCATIGSVQESFPASHGASFIPCPDMFSGTNTGDQAGLKSNATVSEGITAARAIAKT